MGKRCEFKGGNRDRLCRETLLTLMSLPPHAAAAGRSWRINQVWGPHLENQALIRAIASHFHLVSALFAHQQVNKDTCSNLWLLNWAGSCPRRVAGMITCSLLYLVGVTSVKSRLRFSWVNQRQKPACCPPLSSSLNCSSRDGFWTSVSRLMWHLGASATGICLCTPPWPGCLMPHV